jgi:hypothetical protein
MHKLAEAKSLSASDPSERSESQPRASIGSARQEASSPVAKAQPQLRIEDSKVVAAYANFCRITGTPEELIIDFGLNPQPFGPPAEPIAVTQRLIVNFYTAKRMLAALQLTLQRHEAAFGVLETDVQKRVTPAALRQVSSRG